MSTTYLFAYIVVALVQTTPIGGQASCLNVQRDCGVRGNGAVDDTAAFNRCIMSAPSKSVGCIYAPAGIYPVTGLVVNVSNLEMRFDKGAVLQPPVGQSEGIEGMIIIGSRDTATPAHNVSIVGIGGQFVIDCTLQSKINQTIGAIRLSGNVRNFVIGNVRTKMQFCATEVSKTKCLNTNAMAMGNTLFNNISYHPTNGYVYNISNTGSWGGYGLVQVQSAENILFEHLDSTGGVTLRLETGVQFPGSYVGNITGRDIICRDGSSAFLSSPHSQQNGKFEVYDVTTYGCFYGVHMVAGYPQDKQGINHTTSGIFSNDSLIHNVVAYYDKEGAQCDDHCRLNLYNGSSCAACGIGENAAHPTTNIGYRVRLQNVSGVHFPYQHDYSQCVAFNRHEIDCAWWPTPNISSIEY